MRVLARAVVGETGGRLGRDQPAADRGSVEQARGGLGKEFGQLRADHRAEPEMAAQHEPVGRVEEDVDHQRVIDVPSGVAGDAGDHGPDARVVEDIGVGMRRIRIAFHRPSLLGFSSDVLDDPRVGTVVAGYSGDPKLHVQHTLMVHVFLAAPDGLVLRSHFWLGAVMRPDLPEPLADLGARLLNRRAVRQRAIPGNAPAGLADHCGREYAHLASILPELHERFGPSSTTNQQDDGGTDR